MADTNLLVLAKEFSKLRSDVKEVLKMPVGPQGERGEKGERGEPGKPGKDGRDGINGRDGVGVPGRDGRDGIDGVDGKDGKDGVSVTNAYVDFDGSLVIELSDGNQIDAGFVSVESRDSIVQQLKNGALSLNELLPSQTDNANKYLKTDGENTSWDTLTGSDIDLSSPGPIGSTTPAAATFTTLTANGTGGATGFTLGRDTASPTNSARFFLDSSSGAISMLNAGGNTFGFTTGATIGAATGSTQMRITHTASAVNYVQVTGAATTGTPVISAQGSDTNVGITYNTKGSATHTFQTNGTTRLRITSVGAVDLGFNNGVAALQVSGVSSQVNSIQLTGAATGNAPSLSSIGTDTNIDFALTPKGTGTVIVNGPLTATGQTSLGGAAGSESLRVNTVASAVNYVQISGTSSSTGPLIDATGSSSTIPINLRGRGTGGGVNLGSNSGNMFLVRGVSGANPVNYLQVNATTTTNAPVLSSQGSDTNIDLALTPKGTGLVRFGTYTAGAPTATGYISIKAADGTTYKVLVGT